MTRSKAMTPGRLRHVATIQQPPTASDGAGGVTGSWTTFKANVRCAIEPVSGNEAFRSEQTQFRRTHRVTMRYDPTSVPTTAMRFNFGGRLLYVVSILNLDEKNFWLELSCEERAQD